MKSKKYNTPKDQINDRVQEAALQYEPSYLRVIKGGVNLLSIDEARKGISVADFMHLGHKMDLTQTEMAIILNISLRTLQRYPASHILDADASSKVLQLSVLNEKGLDVFTDQKSFNKWLKSNVRELHSNTPLSYLDTGFGFTILQQILGRIEHGIFA